MSQTPAHHGFQATHLKDLRWQRNCYYHRSLSRYGANRGYVSDLNLKEGSILENAYRFAVTADVLCLALAIASGCCRPTLYTTVRSMAPSMLGPLTSATPSPTPSTCSFASTINGLHFVRLGDPR